MNMSIVSTIAGWVFLSLGIIGIMLEAEQVTIWGNLVCANIWFAASFIIKE